MNKTLGQKFFNLLRQNQSPPATLANIKPSTSASNLPSISLNQLQKNFHQNNKKSRLLQFRDQFSLNTEKNEKQFKQNRQFNVCSPFYDRMKSHKPNCKCPYHKRLRQEIGIKQRQTDKPNKLLSLPKAGNHDLSQDKTMVHQRGRQSHPHYSQFLHKSFQILPQSHLYNTTSTNFLKKRVSHRNYSYEQFLKQCQEFMHIRKKGRLPIPPSHVIRKPVKEIFQFINNHLDYTIDKMKQWINTIQKDRDYGEFYIDRFREMKKNYENGRRLNSSGKMNGTAGTLAGSRQSARLRKVRTQKFNINPKNPKQSNKNQSNSSQSSSQSQSQSSNTSQSSLMNLDKLISSLQNQQKLPSSLATDIMNMNLQDFNKMFMDLQSNVLNFHYGDDLLAKFDSGVLEELISTYERQREKNNEGNQAQQDDEETDIQHLDDKISILNRVHQTLRKFMKRKNSSILSQDNRNSLTNNNPSGSRQYLGSKRNTQSMSESQKKSHSKKPSSQSLDSDLQDSSKSTTQQNFQSIAEEQNYLQDEDEGNSLTNPQKALKNLLALGQNVRRSKLLKPEEFLKFGQDDHLSSNYTGEGSTDRFFDNDKGSNQAHKGFFTKAEKYLFDINMGKTIVKKDDSIFTAKRKMRVIKVLLLQNPNSAQAPQLQNYVKTIQQKVLMKTQKQNKPTFLKKMSESQKIEQDQIWRQLTLDNFGYNLIFYSLSSKIKIQDNEDLCILLNQVKLQNVNRFDNKVSSKAGHLFNDDDEFYRKGNKKRTNYKDDGVLVQDGMEDMMFQPEIQSDKEQENTMRMTQTSSKRKSLMQMTALAKQSSLSSFFATGTKQSMFGLNKRLLDVDFDSMNEQQVLKNYEQVKKMLKYAKIHFPETFDKYLKSSSLYQSIQQEDSNFLIDLDFV